MSTLLNSEAEVLNFSKLLWDALGLGRFATDSQFCKWMASGNSKTGTFHQIQTTVGDSAPSVEGVLATFDDLEFNHIWGFERRTLTLTLQQLKHFCMTKLMDADFGIQYPTN